MPLVYFDGFDDVSNVPTQQYDLNAKNYALNNSVSLYGQTDTRYPNGVCLVNSNGTSINKFINSPSSDVIIGVAFKLSNTNATPIIGCMSTTNATVVQIYYTGAAGSIFVKDNAGTNIAITANSIVSINVWYYMEVRIQVATSGIVQILLNGISILNATGINTAAFFPSIYGFQLRGGDGSNGCRFDDMYIVDNTDGTGFLGEVRSVYLVPTANTIAQFTPLTGTNYSQISATYGNDQDSTYVQSSVNGAVDLYQLQTLPYTPNSILGVKASMIAKSTLNPILIKRLLNVNGITIPSYPLNLRNDYNQTYQTDSAYKFQDEIMFTNPITNAPWTITDINTLQVGFQAQTYPIDQYGNMIFRYNPLAYLHLNETTGTTANDVTSNGNNGTYHNYTLNQPGIVPNSVNQLGVLGGSTSYLDVPINSNLNLASGAFSIVGWYKPTSLPTSGNFYQPFCLYSSGNSSAVTGLRIDTSGNIIAYWYDGTPTLQTNTTSSPVIVAGNIYQIILTVNNSAYTVWLNGKSVLTGTFTSTGTWAAHPTIRYGGGAQVLSFSPIDEFIGIVDEVSYYGTTLNKKAIETHYMAGIGSQFNPSDKSANINLVSNNSIAVQITTVGGSVRTNIGRSTGKWYMEFFISSGFSAIAYCGINTTSEATSGFVGQTANGFSYGSDGKFYTNNIGTAMIASNATWLGTDTTTFTNADNIMIAVDLDRGLLWFGKNAVWHDNYYPGGTTAPHTFTPGSTFYPACTLGSVGCNIMYKVNSNTQYEKSPPGFEMWSGS